MTDAWHTNVSVNIKLSGKWCKTTIFILQVISSHLIFKLLLDFKPVVYNQQRARALPQSLCIDSPHAEKAHREVARPGDKELKSPFL